MQFYLGAHQPSWLRSGVIAGPLFVSRKRLLDRKPFASRVPWAMDSGAFSELAKHGKFTVSSLEYARELSAWVEADTGGMLQWAAPLDWMCEPFMVEKTGLTVRQHQHRTLDNYLSLLHLMRGTTVIPVLQGWSCGEYRQHRDDYERAGVDLKSLPLVGLGSVCRRQNVWKIQGLIRELAEDGLKLHAFGFKVDGLREVARWLTSSDSMAWSFAARRRQLRLPDCTHPNHCANCPRWADEWRATEVMPAIEFGERHAADLFTASL